MSVSYKKFNQICRVCMLEDSLMFSLFGKNSVNNDIVTMFMSCCSIKVAVGDGMPDLLCSSCLQRLEIAYSFKQDCEQSDLKLRSLLTENVLTTDCKLQFCDIKTEAIDSLTDDEITGSFECDKIDINSVVKVEVLEGEIFDRENNDNIYNEAIEEKQYNLRNVTKKVTIKKKRKQTIKNKLKILRQRPSYQCNICNKSFEQHKRFWSHKEVHPFYTCYVCWEEFDNIQILEDHQKVHSDDVYVCNEELCDSQFNSCQLFIMHKKDDHKLINYLHCNMCEKTFSSHEQWHIHVRKHIRQQNHKCPVCSKRFTRQCYLDKHVKLHSTKYKCEKCDRTFTAPRKLEAHKRTHSDKKSTCGECGKKFAQGYNLARHVNVVHKGVKLPKREKKHLCPHCGQVFARPVDLTIHIRLHTGVKPFSCDNCEYRCHDKQLLRSHVRKHSGLRPYKCSYCDKAFGSRSYLTIHERFHSGYRPYVCSKCSKGFTNSKDLKVHERTHTGIKLFNCSTCNNSFTTLHYLRVHMKKHDAQ